MENSITANPFALLEAPRALAELASIPFATPLLSQSRRGDNHGIFVIPGFGATDQSTFVLRRFLDLMGYRTSGWGLGRNLGIEPAGVTGRLIEHFLSFQQKVQGKVSLIGWSLGGIHARRIARLEAPLVRQVICLGSPINGVPESSRVYRVYNRANGNMLQDDALRKIVIQGNSPLSVPCTSIYSKSDGVVPWQFSVDKNAIQSDNIEIVASHLGLGVNPSVLYIIADRLAQPTGEWQRFDRRHWRNRAALALLNPLSTLLS
jgi:pimeloyl-ACP methyl ester carboxylesterase